MMNLRKKLGFAALLAFGAVSSANASLVVLDDFNYATPIDITVSAGTPVASTTRDDINSFDGDVTYDLNLTVGNGANTESFAVSGGILTYNNAALSQSDLVITYSETSGNGSGPIDLTGGGAQDAFYFDVLESDAGFDVQIFVGSSLTDVSYLVSTSTEITTLTRTTEKFDTFSTLAGSGADFSSVAFVRILILANTNSVDLALKEFGTTSVPEPSTVAIFGLALVGFGLSAKRKAK